jgi:hypothetical protein
MDLLPANSAEIEKLVAERLSAWEDGPLKLSMPIDWRGSDLPLPVISIPVKTAYYNPHSRRIQAQKDVDEARSRKLAEDPFSDEAQSYLDELLQWDPANPGQIDPAFEKLKEDLEGRGQKEPGLMTRSGILINGNTRRAALRSLGQPNIRVGILPADTSRADIDNLELSLQLQRSYKRDYSFVNELMSISEYVKRGIPTKEVLESFNMKRPRLDRSLWLLQLIDDAIARSKTTDSQGKTVSLRRYDFERDQGQLEELYRAWHTLNQTDAAKAELLRETRLIAVVLNLAKTDMRVMQEDFVSKYVAPKLNKAYLPEVAPAKAQSIPGLPGVTLPGESDKVLQIKALANSALQAEAIKKQATLADPAPASVTTLLTDLTSAYKAGKKLAGADEEYRKKGTTPASRILQASDQLDFATSAVADANAVRSLDIQALEDSLETLRQSMTSLAQVLSRVKPSDEMDVGFAWIQTAVNANIDPAAPLDSSDTEQDGL